ncbi:putative CRISPR-associated negative autoregulator [Crocosphaera subtropica ATCC 51142]|uniref:CRISPR-associated negative autoregulator n=1 Tax=Crocosphaera subtropica (strain ATCC 51142 / BH68) TaxID=43989 RepID=B1WUU5_CROS5|nr:type I-B CRISPR-associated protein Cas7/Cst2/DevR [Crocosphaera subtropica]ACB50546.1 putative CRISPR-associated negative autoregulator [Crocosphaera subtropica ATCC 51142]
MSQHIFVTVVTPTAVAANNRGEGDGSTLSTLQKITRGNDQYTTVSADAIRWGYRERLQNYQPENVNRTFDPEADKYNFKDEKYNAETYIDDDLFGFMDAKKDKDNKDATTKRRGALEVSRAISLDPYWGDIVFGSKGGKKDNKSIHNTEVHCTAYQYTMALTPSSLKDPERAKFLLEAIPAIKHVGGNHARFLYEFRPESIVIRVTEDPSPWILGCFERVGESVGCSRLVRLVEVKDVPASELIVAGEIADTPYGKQLKSLGVEVKRGIKEAIIAAKGMLKMEVTA